MKKLFLFLFITLTFSSFANDFLSEDVKDLKNFRVFDKLKMDWEGYSAMNALPLFSIGSWVQGDFKPALINTILQTTGGLVVALDLLTIKTGSISAIGGAIFAIGYFWGLIAPIFYSNFYNEKLINTLNINFIFDIEKEMVYKFAVKVAI